jgi:hypothetical protein
MDSEIGIGRSNLFGVPSPVARIREMLQPSSTSDSCPPPLNPASARLRRMGTRRRQLPWDLSGLSFTLAWSVDSIPLQRHFTDPKIRSATLQSCPKFRSEDRYSFTDCPRSFARFPKGNCAKSGTPSTSVRCSFEIVQHVAEERQCITVRIFRTR